MKRPRYIISATLLLAAVAFACMLAAQEPSFKVDVQLVRQGAETIVGKGEPKAKKEKAMKPVTPLKRDVSNPQDAETIVSKGEPKAKKEKAMKPVTAPKRDVSVPSDAEAIVQKGDAYRDFTPAQADEGEKSHAGGPWLCNPGMRELSAEGLVSRIQGVGTFVAVKAPRWPYPATAPKHRNR